MGQDWAMAHSLLSVPLNLGVLHPLDAVEAAEQAYRRKHAELPAVEGFIRQILGWREYMWHLYWHFGPDYMDNNALNATMPLPDWWTGLTPPRCAPSASTTRWLGCAIAAGPTTSSA